MITIFIYQKTIKNQNSEVDKIIEENSLAENSNNLIKNLKYNVNFENNSSYRITAGESELIDENNVARKKNSLLFLRIARFKS